jgi:hypothetical protein
MKVKGFEAFKYHSFKMTMVGFGDDDELHTRPDRAKSDAVGF